MSVRYPLAIKRRRRRPPYAADRELPRPSNDPRVPPKRLGSEESFSSLTPRSYGHQNKDHQGQHREGPAGPPPEAGGDRPMRVRRRHRRGGVGGIRTAQPRIPPSEAEGVSFYCMLQVLNESLLIVLLQCPWHGFCASLPMLIYVWLFHPSFPSHPASEVSTHRCSSYGTRLK